MNILKAITSLALSYVIAAPLTDRISMDLTQTDWTSGWTYLIWVFASMIWAGIIFGVVFIAAVAGSISSSRTLPSMRTRTSKTHRFTRK